MRSNESSLPLDFAQVLSQELELIRYRRKRIRAMAPAPPVSETDGHLSGASAANANGGRGEGPDVPHESQQDSSGGSGSPKRGSGSAEDGPKIPDQNLVPQERISDSTGPTADSVGPRPETVRSGTETRPPGVGCASNGEEQAEVAAQNAGHEIASKDRPGHGEVRQATQSALPETEKQKRLAAMDRHLVGLALSGGGIRSATFALGVLQGLAHLKILSRFDYLSTVSGGGYIGGWLAAWMKREGDPLAVETQLSPSRITESTINRDVIGKDRIVDEEPEPVHHLRAYSNYLTPRPGLLSVDTWTLLTIYIRNSLINLLLLLPLTMILVLLGRAAVLFYGLPGREEGLRSGVFWSFTALFLLAILSVGLHISVMLNARARSRRGERPAKHRGIWTWTLNLTILWPLVASAGLACWTFSVVPRPSAVRAGGRELDKASFTIRVPGPFPEDESLAWDPELPIYANASNWINNQISHLQPDSDEATFPFLDRFFDAKKPVFDAWHEDREFLLASAIEFGVTFGLGALAIHLIGYLILFLFQLDPEKTARQEGPKRSRLIGFLWMSSAAFIAGFTGGFLLLAMASEILWRLNDQPYAILTVGPPLALVVFVVATFVEVWLLGRWQGDDLREWWARVCAWLLIYAAAWLAFFGLTLYGPMLVNQVLSSSFLRTGAALGWLSTVAGGAFAGRSIQTKGARSAWLVKILVRVAPPLFAFGLLIGVAVFVDGLVFDRLTKRLANQVDARAPWVYWNGVVTTPIDHIVKVGVVCAALLGLATLMSNVNLFSLNSMYASRLTRCYLGASRRKKQWNRRGPGWESGPGGAPTGTRGSARRENAVTGFDHDDDIPLWRMRIGPNPASESEHECTEPEYLGPHLIINTALNLVAGGELAWQDRKAESFVLTPSHCGSKGTGYAPTTSQTGRELTLGRAVAISGAAVDSNIGLQQSSALIALMTAFNARLGWWIKNPNPSTWSRWSSSPAKGKSEWDAGSPSLALPLLLELLGQTDEKKKWVHISDGGHFENLAVYELIRRRCRYIVSCDAGTDPQASDDNLATMIRLCRIDFGVRIEIDTAPLACEGPTQASRWHCAVGKIRYDDVDGGELPGIFVYLRSSLTGDEPPDVQEYAAKNPDFPRQSTLDQFFNESQFESYRALGFHVAQLTFRDALADVTDFEPLWTNHDPEIEFKRGNQRLFSAVQRRWAPVPSNQDKSFVEAAESWIDFQKALRKEKSLRPLSLDIYPEQAALGSIATRESADASAELHASAQMIQVMENAWIDLRLSGSRDLPMNRGWMSVFRRWASTRALRRYWPVLRVEYSQDFVKFCEIQLGLGSVDAAVKRGDMDPDFFAQTLKHFDDEFAREWPTQVSMADLVNEADASWGEQSNDRPIYLLIRAPVSKGKIAESPDKFGCGIVFARSLPSDGLVTGAPERFEIFIWLRRAYRGMGIASRCAKSILVGFRQIVWAQDRPRSIRLETRYPANRMNSGDAMEFGLWSNFFSHYDFRCPRGQEPITDGYWVIERTFDRNDLDI